MWLYNLSCLPDRLLNQLVYQVIKSRCTIVFYPAISKILHYTLSQVSESPLPTQ